MGRRRPASRTLLLPGGDEERSPLRTEKPRWAGGGNVGVGEGTMGRWLGLRPSGSGNWRCGSLGRVGGWDGRRSRPSLRHTTEEGMMRTERGTSSRMQAKEEEVAGRERRPGRGTTRPTMQFSVLPWESPRLHGMRLGHGWPGWGASRDPSPSQALGPTRSRMRLLPWRETCGNRLPFGRGQQRRSTRLALDRSLPMPNPRRALAPTMSTLPLSTNNAVSTSPTMMSGDLVTFAYVSVVKQNGIRFALGFAVVCRKPVIV